MPGLALACAANSGDGGNCRASLKSASMAAEGCCVGVVMRAAWPRTLGFLVCALLLSAALGGTSDARRPDGPPATGLKNVAYAKQPPDFWFDLGAGPTRLRALVRKPVVL